ncbi:MAG: Bax inhibitor-1/YccA family protein [Campylobacterales bacterium]
MRSGNPALNDKTFEGLEASQEAMTLEGTVNKTALLLLLVVLTASWTWERTLQAESPAQIAPYILIGALGGFVVGLITIFAKRTAGYTAPAYALLEGLALGGLSALFEMKYPGIVLQAVGLTFGTLFCMLGAYRSGLIKPTENFKLGVVAATGGIAVLYLVDLGLSVFLGQHVPFIHESGPLGIAFSVFVVIIAALNLVLDFDFIETGVENGSPKYMDWNKTTLI